MFLNTLWWAIAAGGKCTTYVIFEMRDNIKRTHTLTAQRHTQTAVHIQTVLVGTCFFLSVTAHTQWVFVYASKFIPFVSFIFHFLWLLLFIFMLLFQKTHKQTHSSIVVWSGQWGVEHSVFLGKPSECLVWLVAMLYMMLHVHVPADEMTDAISFRFSIKKGLISKRAKYAKNKIFSIFSILNLKKK